MASAIFLPLAPLAPVQAQADTAVSGNSLGSLAATASAVPSAAGSYNSRNTATGGVDTTLRQLNTPRQPITSAPHSMPSGHIQGVGV
jgi:hypothetical protein